jgi:hypothetical protein
VQSWATFYYGNHAPVKVAVLLLVMFYAFHRLLERPRPMRIAWAGAAMAMSIVADFAEMAFLTIQSSVYVRVTLAKCLPPLVEMSLAVLAALALTGRRELRLDSQVALASLALIVTLPTGGIASIRQRANSSQFGPLARVYGASTWQPYDQGRPRCCCSQRWRPLSCDRPRRFGPCGCSSGI